MKLFARWSVEAGENNGAGEAGSYDGNEIIQRGNRKNDARQNL